MLAVLACLGVLALGGLWVLHSDTRPGVTKANFDRIEKRMTLAEVRELFGREGVVFHGYVNQSAYLWENADRSFAIVLFDDAGKVTEAAAWKDSTERIGDKIRRWIRWPWWK
jgi:hypothetical protein